MLVMVQLMVSRVRESRDPAFGGYAVCNFVVGDAQRLPFSDDCFDAITSLCVIDTFRMMVTLP